MALQRKQQPKQRQEEFDCDGKISLWTPQESKKYVISGLVEIDGQSYRVYIYENNFKKHERSPDYYGSLFLNEDEEEAPRAKKKSSKQRPPVKVKPVVEYEEIDEDDESEVDLDEDIDF